MLIIFIAVGIGVLISAPLLLRSEALKPHSEDEEPLLPDEPVTPLPESLRWLVRFPIALFLGFVLTGIVNEHAASIALGLGKDVLLDHAGKAVALWPQTALGKTLEILALSLPFLAGITWIDRRWIAGSIATAETTTPPQKQPVPAMQERPSTATKSRQPSPNPRSKRGKSKRS
jgi:hypothetical protein